MNFPHLYSNIPTAPAYLVYVSPHMRTTRAWICIQNLYNVAAFWGL